MINSIIEASLKNKLIVILATLSMAGFGVFALLNLPIGAVPDVTNNQVQVITTSRNLSTLDVERFITYPIELEMANLPGLKEIRSVSKFGLSVVTIVFDDNLGTYLPRQLIAERIRAASGSIPEGFGQPFMGPISTGLGEIYQYVIEVDPAYDSLYSITDLRTIQDWVIRRQLSGIPGVVEVNTWGGNLKQYEVALNPNRLMAMDISIGEVFAALEKNNSVVGGGYIEKTNQSFFIRGEGLAGSIDELNEIVVSNKKGAIVRVADVGEVRFGSATRFGAITANGQGEKVLGQVMMLKDANSNKVINAVKERVKEVSATLPPGIHINGFLDRSALIAKTTFTIAENLILGCLIVIFVVVLLLGNIRSGLVVASVIPLSLLFALSMMYFFKVDANLMSLGAIDFGIIIDGAVIIVEFIAYQIVRNSGDLNQLQSIGKQILIDKITLKGTKKLMRSAMFGQLIIIIVFIPILSLSGIEGKMFRPMAQVFTFALIGTMLLGFTYVPVVSSMFLRPPKHEKNISTRLIGRLTRWYIPSIGWALNNRKLVLGLTILILAGSVLLFTRMGGEFVPTLDEGDFVIQPVIKTGTTLSKTIALTTRMEQILKTFPEVDQVVSRIGAAEVPTDPMSMEECDIIITLKPHKEWVTANTKDELADRFKEALRVIPGIDYEFTQPIEMRFNELITGTRSDLAIKIFGEELEVLSALAGKIKSMSEGVEGASDVTVEKVTGLPEMTINYNRTKLALYGLSVDDVNKVISMAYAGLKAGEIFEGEKCFDVVLRYQDYYRKATDQVQNASVPLPGGGQVPLSELAEVTESKGPAKISRDNTRRRIVVGVNVRNRDIESVVGDISSLISKNIRLPDGYSIDFGGQFENLRSAKARLMIAVPIALILIFTLLHLALGSFREALMVYTAIPLSAVGGILLLALRGLPFSISAGVGFIALFGIAVLNGIVLIEHFKELERRGMTDLKQLILRGTAERLRPVLLTASAAALGFLPMAVSTSAGAEVQRPLATVVVGGLITATLLTLIVLPVLYFIFQPKDKEAFHLPLPKQSAILLILLVFPTWMMAQEKKISRNEAIQLALKQNASLKVDSLRMIQSSLAVKQAFNPDKTGVYYTFDQNNIAANDLPLKVFGIQQSLSFPGVYSAQRKAEQSRYKQEQLSYQRSRLSLEKEVSKAYDACVYRKQLFTYVKQLDSLYYSLLVAANREYELGGTRLLEKLTAEARQRETSVLRQQAAVDLEAAQLRLQKLLHSTELLVPEGEKFEKLTVIRNDSDHDELNQFYGLAISAAQYDKNALMNDLLPELHLEYFLGSNAGTNAKTYHGFQVGLGIPVWFFARKATVSSAKLQTEILRQKASATVLELDSRKNQLFKELELTHSRLTAYEQGGKRLTDEIRKTARLSFSAGQINFFQYLSSLEDALQLDRTYLENLYQYNQIVLEINYFTF